MEIIFWIVLIPLLLFSTISIYNFFTAPLLRHKEYKTEDFVSILIPARNEEKNIGKCISMVLSQSHTNFELLVLDDNSTDKTAEIVNNYSNIDARVKYIKGTSLPEGWLGKNWACHQLSEAASGELFIFIDADVELTSYAIESVLSEYSKNAPGLLSVFPTQQFKTFGEWLIVPLMNWILLTFLPLKKVYTSTNPSFCAANGQFLVISKKNNLLSGGHYAVKHKVVEDMELCRLQKMFSNKVYTMLGGGLIKCRMYGSFTEAFMGFSKNFFAGTNLSPAAFMVIVLIITLIFLIPVVLVKTLWIHLILILIIRVIISLLSRQNPLMNSLLHLLQMPIFLVTAIVSLLITLKKKREWKGRIF